MNCEKREMAAPWRFPNPGGSRNAYLPRIQHLAGSNVRLAQLAYDLAHNSRLSNNLKAVKVRLSKEATEEHKLWLPQLFPSLAFS